MAENKDLEFSSKSIHRVALVAVVIGVIWSIFKSWPHFERTLSRQKAEKKVERADQIIAFLKKENILNKGKLDFPRIRRQSARSVGQWVAGLGRRKNRIRYSLLAAGATLERERDQKRFVDVMFLKNHNKGLVRLKKINNLFLKAKKDATSEAYEQAIVSVISKSPQVFIHRFFQEIGFYRNRDKINEAAVQHFSQESLQSFYRRISMDVDNLETNEIILNQLQMMVSQK